MPDPVSFPTRNARAPWTVPALAREDLEPADRTILFRMYTGQYGDGRGVLYSPKRGLAPRLRGLAALGLVEFYDHSVTPGWTRDMWGARLTVLGANTVFRNDGTLGRASHPGCVGYFSDLGECTECRAKRPLDLDAYSDYLSALRDLDNDSFETQRNGPQLWCTEHGHLRRADITTKKVCGLPGTEFHDGGLFRI